MFFFFIFAVVQKWGKQFESWLIEAQFANPSLFYLYQLRDDRIIRLALFCILLASMCNQLRLFLLWHDFAFCSFDPCYLLQKLSDSNQSLHSSWDLVYKPRSENMFYSCFYRVHDRNLNFTFNCILLIASEMETWILISSVSMICSRIKNKNWWP